MAPQTKIPRAPPNIPTYLIAEGVAKIPIPIKHLNILKYVYATLVVPLWAVSGSIPTLKSKDEFKSSSFGFGIFLSVSPGSVTQLFF